MRFMLSVVPKPYDKHDDSECNPGKIELKRECVISKKKRDDEDGNPGKEDSKEYRRIFHTHTIALLLPGFQFFGDLPGGDFGKCGEVIVEVASDVHISLSQL